MSRVPTIREKPMDPPVPGFRCFSFTKKIATVETEIKWIVP